MTEFQKKRLAYLIKQAEKCEWIQLGKGDIDIIYSLQNEAQEGYSRGYHDGVIKGQEDIKTSLRIEHGIYP